MTYEELLTAENERLKTVNEHWQKNSIEMHQAFQAMRDTINEYIPMPSIEADLLEGPEFSVSCANLAKAVIGYTQQIETYQRVHLAAQALVSIGNWCPNRDDGSIVNWTNFSEVTRLRARFAVMQADALIVELAKGGAQ